MEKKLVSGIMLTLLLTSILIMAFTVQIVKSESPLPLISLKPLEYTARLGESFTINVTVANVTNLFGFEFKLWYNTAILNAIMVSPTAITQGATHWLPVNASGIFNFDRSPTINNAIGRVWIFGFGFPTFNGSGTLVSIKFTATGIGGCALHFNDTGLYNTLGDQISHDTVDGYVNSLQTIKIGVVGPKGGIQWDGLWEGAQMARDEINNAGGINIGGTFYNIQLVDIDEHSYPIPDPAAAVAELLAKLDANPDMQFLIGGFRAECVAPMEEAAMDYAAVHHRPIWILVGAAADSLISVVQTNYTRYKYMFRMWPLNSIVMAQTFATFIGQVVAPKLAKLYGVTLVPTYIIAENLSWCDSMVAFIKANGVAFGMDVKGVRRPSPVATDFSADISNATAAGAKIVVHIFSAVGGINFIKQVGALKPDFVCIGINVESQQQEFYANVSGACEYETILAPSGTTTPLSAGAVAFYDETLSRFGHAPIYTSYGAYDAIYTLKEAIERAGTTDSDAVIPELEKTNRMSTLGKFKFTGPNPNLNTTNYPYLARNPTMMGTLHDVFCNEIGSTWTQGYIRPLVFQWQKRPQTGEPVRVVVWPQDHVYSRKWGIPTWIYPLAETDFALCGKVNATDLSILAAAYGSRPGSPNWNPDCDIDGNGIVNMMDVARFAVDWGKDASPLSAGTVGASVETASPIPATTQTDPNATVYFDMPTINCTKYVSVGSVTVNLMISGAVNLTAWGADIAYNPNLLEYIAPFTPGTLLPQFSSQVTDYYGTSNPTLGTITGIGQCAYNTRGASVGGQLAQITFKVKAGGVTDLHIRNATMIPYWRNISYYFQMAPFKTIDTYTVTSSPAQTSLTASNSTGVDEPKGAYSDGVIGSGFYNHAFNHSIEQLSFNVTGPYPGWSNVTIPKTLLNVSILDQVLVIIDGEPLKIGQRAVTENKTDYFVRFNYTAGIHNILILKRPPVYNIDRNRYYNKIQDAINAVVPGHKDRILAYAGIHSEYVVVNKTVTLIGEYKHNTTIYGIGNTAIRVTASNVTIANFTINSGNPDGILVAGSSNNIISNNNVTGNYIGICLNDSSDNTLTNNTMSGNTYNFGLYGTEASDFNNTIDRSNTVNGKPVYYVKNVSNTVYGLSCNAGTFYLINCKNVTIRSLTLTKNVNGIFLWNTNSSKIQNVTSSNNFNGIYLQYSNNNNIYHNSFIENTIQANVTESYNNNWDDGYPSGGNYWSDYSLRPPFVVDEFKGVNQTVQGNDGIIDNPKVIDPKNRDKYPLVSPLTPPVYDLNTYTGYTKIQDAINSSRSGDTIFVRTGTYPENLIIKKPLTLIGIIGSTVINGTGTVIVTITADNVTFRGFTIQGSTSTTGILVYRTIVSHTKNVYIEENNVTKNEYGIYLNDSEGCSISGNTIKNNTYGIWLESSGSNIVSRNNVTKNEYGIYLTYYSSGNDIHRNNITYNTEEGILLSQSSKNMIYYNNFNNTAQAQARAIGSDNNAWDNGTEGNYWSHAYMILGGSVNNTDRFPLVNPWVPQHDVAVVNILRFATYQPYPASITIIVENQGDYTEKFNVTVYYKTTTIFPLTNITLTGESSRWARVRLTFTWDTRRLANGNYTITACAWHNNCTGWVEVRLWGLVAPYNNVTKPYHTTVTLRDVALLDLIFSYVSPFPGPPPSGPYDQNHPETYYPYMPDINCDGTVSLADVGKLDLIFSAPPMPPP